ncbi:MAG: 3-oxoacyl-[acyl-carrier protein] reductase [Cellvibrionaceae bacterium]|jgi:3-oxoacyl-[acyl-carrier protein] reductase
MDLNLKGKVIMVAAGSRGLGFGIAEACAKEGANVSIGSRSQDKVDSAVMALEKFGSGVQGATLDAKDADSILEWTDGVLSRFGRIDGLVVNAGGPPAGKFDDFDENAWYDAFELTLMSAVRMIRSVLPTMREQQSGSILTVTSSAIKEPIDTILLSNVMRSGVTSLVKSLSRDLAAEGIRINNLVPGTIKTDRITQLAARRAEMKGIDPDVMMAEMESPIPMGRFGSAQEFGRTGAFLLSDAAAYTTGVSYFVDGGLSRTLW